MVFEFSKCSADEMLSLLLPSRFRRKHMVEITLLGKIIYSLRSLSPPISLHLNSCLLLVQSSISNMFLKIAKRLFKGR
jgi:hypothetical protein